MNIKWKLDYGIEWAPVAKGRPCPECNWTKHDTYANRTDSKGYLKLRQLQCKRCGYTYSTIECDTERFLDLLNTEKTVERAIQIETTLKQIVNVVQDTLKNMEDEK